MKKAFALTTVIAVVVLAVGAYAASPLRMKVDIPFTFTAGSVQLPAGEYLVELAGMSPYAATGSSVVFRDGNGAAAAVIFSTPASHRGNGGAEASVVFNKYGQAYFLAEVRQPLLQVEVAKSKAEKEVSLAYGMPRGEPTVLQGEAIR